MIRFQIGVLSSIAMTLACSQQSTLQVTTHTSHQDGVTATLEDATGTAATDCPVFKIDLSSVKLGAISSVYTFVAMKNSAAGSNKNQNQISDNVLTVEPSNCRSYPQGEWFVNTIQLFGLDADTKTSVSKILFADTKQNVYLIDDKASSIGLQFVSFGHPDNLLDKVVDAQDKYHVARLLREGCEFNLAEGFTPCEPTDKRFYYVDQFYRQLEILLVNVKSPAAASLPKATEASIVAAVEANKAEIAGKYNYVTIIAPYAQKLVDLSTATKKSFTKSIYLSWETAMPVIDYLHSALIGNDSRIKALASWPGQSIMLTTSFWDDQDSAAINVNAESDSDAKAFIARLDQASLK